LILFLELEMSSADSSEPLPPYSYVPGGPWPHPTRSPQGHSYGRTAPKVELTGAGSASVWPRFLRGAELFNAGYYWEAHEVWEGLWHAYGRHGAEADVVKALIKLAAAGVKVREGQEHGVRVHSRRAAELFSAAREQAGHHRLGLDLQEWSQRAHEIADLPPRDPGPAGSPVVRVFAFRIEIVPSHPANG
jgi:hypothetical protein